MNPSERRTLTVPDVSGLHTDPGAGVRETNPRTVRSIPVPPVFVPTIKL